MREIGHFIGGKEVKGASGRFSDVFNPNTGEVQAKVALAKHSEVEHAIANAEAAQPAWAATNPQRRARVMFKFLDLVAKDMDSLAKLLSSEHGKVLADARGDIQRGVEVVEFACGIPHLMKGEYSRRRRPRHRSLFAAPAARRRRRHHAVQFPGHDPAVEMRAGDRLRQCLHPEAVGARPVGADAHRRTVPGSRPAAGHPQRRQRRQGSGRYFAQRRAREGDRLRRLLRDRRIHLCDRLRQRQARAVLRRRQEPHDRDAGRRHGSGGRRADRRRLRLRRRALHGGVGGGAGRAEDRRHPDRQAHPARRKPQDRSLHRRQGRLRPDGDARPAQQSARLHRHRRQGRRQARWSTAAASNCKATRTATSSAAVCSTRSSRT